MTSQKKRYDQAITQAKQTTEKLERLKKKTQKLTTNLQQQLLRTQELNTNKKQLKNNTANLVNKLALEDAKLQQQQEIETSELIINYRKSLKPLITEQKLLEQKLELEKKETHNLEQNLENP